MTLLYGIPNCDKCRAARKWFTAAGIDFRFHDLRQDGLNSEQVGNWLEQLGNDALLNRRSATWRQLTDAERKQAGGDGAVALILQHPTLLKRPLIETGEQLLVGYDEASWRAALA